ncbi:MAG: GIY-YIG nuclease family protein [Salibacteraceae bacterium]
MERGGYVYIMSNVIRSVLYIGVTSELAVRVFQHKSLKGSSFTSKYKCIHLIYYEGFKSIEEAITKEKQMKKWKQEWKIKAIRSLNPNLIDLSEQIIKERF